MATIKSVSTLIVDGDWIESKDQSPEGIRLVQTGNIGIGEYLDKTNRAKYISEETFARLKCTELVEGDVLVSRLPDPIGRACVVSKDVGRAITAVDCTIIRLDPNKCDTEFFVQYTQSDLYQNRLAQFLAGSTRTRISRKNLEQIEIPLPDIAEQKQVALILGKVDELITLRKEQLAKLDQLVKSRFVEVFGDPVQNPMGWPISALSEHINFLTSGSRGWAQYFSDNGEYFITIKNVKNCKITLDDVQYVLPPNNAEAKRTKVQEGDLLISITADLGRTGVVTKEIADYGGYINQHLTCIRLDRSAVRPLYVAYYMESDAGKEQFMSKNQSAVKAGLNFNAINSLKLMVPPVELQDSFIDFVEQTDKTKLTIQSSLDKLETLKKSLMQEYFG